MPQFRQWRCDDCQHGGNATGSGSAYTEITLGTGITISGGVLNVATGTGNVSNVGTPLSGQIPIWTTATTIEGITQLSYTNSVYDAEVRLGSGSDNSSYSFGANSVLEWFSTYMMVKKVRSIDFDAGSGDTTITRSGAGTIAVEGVDVVLQGGPLGTPLNGTLTNCTGYPERVKAWVSFDGTSAADITTATYSRTLTTVTVTLNGHGYLTGHVVYIDFTSGGALDGVYTITGVATNTFTVTTAASGTIAAGSTMNLLRRTIRASAGVHSVTYQNTVGRFYVNFSTAMTDANYAPVVNAASGTVAAKIGGFGFVAPTAQSCDIWTSTLAGTLENEAYSSVTFTR